VTSVMQVRLEGMRFYDGVCTLMLPRVLFVGMVSDLGGGCGIVA
jgi:hypothetical protein